MGEVRDWDEFYPSRGLSLAPTPQHIYSDFSENFYTTHDTNSPLADVGDWRAHLFPRPRQDFSAYAKQLAYRRGLFFFFLVNISFISNFHHGLILNPFKPPILKKLMTEVITIITHGQKQTSFHSPECKTAFPV